MKKVIIAILSILFFALVVRADDAAKYRAFVDTIKAEVFATELTALKTKDIPEKYRNSSAVIKAVYESVEARKEDRRWRWCRYVRTTYSHPQGKGRIRPPAAHVGTRQRQGCYRKVF